MSHPKPKAILMTLPLVAAMTVAAPFTLAAENRESDDITLEEVSQELVDAGAVIANYSADQRDEAIAAGESALADLDARIERAQAWVDAHWEEMSEEAREKVRATMTSLRQRRNQAAEWMGGLKHSSAEAWEDVKSGFADAWAALEQSWAQAREELGPGA